jgi:predicted RecA/RadA family phage recombinase
MAEASFKHGKPRMVEHTPSGAVAAGDVVVTGSTPRVAHNDIATGELGYLAASGGIYEMTGDDTLAADLPVYWDASESKVSATDDSGTNVFFGFTVTECEDDGEPCLVRHNPQAILDDGD